MITRDTLIGWLGAHVQDKRPSLLVKMTDDAPTTLDYNRFLYELVLDFRPERMVETGTDRGRSAAHMALGNPNGFVHTIDIDPACSQNAKDLRLPNLVVWTGDSLGVIQEFDDKSIDLLFLDSLHTYEHTKAEWEAFKPKLRPDALVLIDDIALDAGMARFWDELPEPKLEMNHLHFSGFGAWWPWWSR